MQPFLFLIHVASQVSRIYFPYESQFAFEAEGAFLQDGYKWGEWAERLYQLSDPKQSRFIQCFSSAASRRVLANAAATQAQICADNDIIIVAFSDSVYPPLLRHILDPPLCFFLKGDPQVLLLPQLSVIGSRRCSQEAAAHATALGYQAAKQGISIVSGGA